MPNADVIKSSHTARLEIPGLPLAATISHIVPGLKAGHLISLSQFCDSGCTVVLDAKKIDVILDDVVILTGHRDPTTRLWFLHLTKDDDVIHHQVASAHHVPPLEFYSLHAYQTPSTKQLIAFYHGALFSPVLSTLTNAIQKGYLHGFPGLTVENLKKNPPHTAATSLGHLDQKRKNVKSTQNDTTEPTLEQLLAQYCPPSDVPNERTHLAFLASVHLQPGQVFSDQTGAYKVPSATGNVQLMIFYDYDSNAIFVEPMKGKSKEGHVQAYQNIMKRLLKAGLRPKVDRLDNEISQELKEYLDEHSITFQLAPPGCHRRNAAERAVRTFKNHFVAGLCSLPGDFPLRQWDQLLPQAEMSINLLRGSRLNPQLSAYAQVNGPYLFDKNPIAPPGMPVIIHIKPDNRGSWDPHGEPGFYLGPSFEHYRCYCLFARHVPVKKQNSFPA